MKHWDREKHFEKTGVYNDIILENMGYAVSQGIPLIARIPVLKWLFGVSTDNKVDEKLSIFIKPTVIF